jgi:hypothetical protein
VVHLLECEVLRRAISSRFAARAAAGSLVAFLDLQTQVDYLLFKVCDLEVEAVDVDWRALVSR